MSRFEEIFGARFTLLGRQILTLSALGQTCDVTFFRNEPAIDVTVDERLALAAMRGAGPARLYEMFRGIRLSNGSVVNMGDIWTVNRMPKEGFTREESKRSICPRLKRKSGRTAGR